MVSFLVVRVSRPGRICSGDYLTANQKVDLKYYERFEGIFIIIVAVFELVVFVAAFVFYRLLGSVRRDLEQEEQGEGKEKSQAFHSRLSQLARKLSLE